MFKKIFGSKSEKETNEQVGKIDLISNEKNYYTISSNVISKILELAKSRLDESKLHINNIPDKKLSNVVNIYNVDGSRIIALYDTTVFNSGKDGIILCDYFIGLKHAFGSAMIVEFKDLVIAEINEGEKALQINDHNINIKLKEFTIFFQQLKELLILEDSYLKSKYEDYVISTLQEIKFKIDNRHYNEAESRFLMLEKILTNNSIEFCASLYYYGCLIRMEQFNFEQAYSYFSLLEGLQQWENNKIIELKQTIDQSKIQYKFNLLEEQKNAFIQENQYNKAIEIANEQKILNIKSYEQLDQEINKIELLKKEYVQSLELRVEKNLEHEEYKDVLNTLEVLKEANPNFSYDEYYIRAKTGIFEFEEVEERINAIKEVNQQLAEKLEQTLQNTKINISEKIREAVRCKDYSLFINNPSFKYVKDSWGMIPLMHFIIQKDLEGVKLLADTFDPTDQNAIGHTALNLVTLDYEDEFCYNALMLLDDKLIQMMKKYKTNNSLNKVGKLALDGLDSLNGRSYMSFEVAKITSNVKNEMNKSLKEFEDQTEYYADSLLMKNYKEFVKYSMKPKDYNGEYNELLAEKHKINNELEKLQEKKSQLENSLEDRLKEAKNDKLDYFIFEAAGIELGEKDEFETSSEYESRKIVKAREIKLTYLENDYVKEQLECLDEEVKIINSNELKNIESLVDSKTKELKSMENNISKIHYLLNCQSKIDVNEILGYYYHIYQSKLDIGLYDADLEYFNISVNNDQKSVIVPRKVAKEFKMEFSDLKPAYKMEIVKDGNKEKIQHNFVYNFEGEQITVPFMLSLA